MTEKQHIVFALTAKAIDDFREDATPVEIIAMFMGQVSGSAKEIIIDSTGEIHPTDKVLHNFAIWEVWEMDDGGLAVSRPGKDKEGAKLLKGAKSLGGFTKEAKLRYLASLCIKLKLNPENIIINKLGF